jgi:hypothetical protein
LRKALREGKKVRRPNWKEGSYWEMGTDEIILFNSKYGVGTIDEIHGKATVHLNQLEADDWEIIQVKKEFCLSDHEQNIHTNIVYYRDEVKEFIKKIKEVPKMFTDTAITCHCDKQKRLWIKGENRCYDCEIVK